MRLARLRFLYIDECLEVSLRLMRSECGDVLNVGSDEMVSINALVAMITSVAAKAVRLKHIPGPPASGAGTPHRRKTRVASSRAPHPRPREDLSLDCRASRDVEAAPRPVCLERPETRAFRLRPPRIAPGALTPRTFTSDRYFFAAIGSGAAVESCHNLSLFGWGDPNRGNRHNRAGHVRELFKTTRQFHIRLVFRSRILAALLPAPNNANRHCVRLLVGVEHRIGDG
jgi:hypothetical protein